MWASSDTFTAGGDVVRVRSSTPDAAAVVRTLLGDRLVEDRPDAPIDWSVRLEPPASGAQPLHVLYEGCAAVRRSRDPLRVLQTLVARVSGRDGSDSTGALHVAGCALVGVRGAVVLPASLEADVAAVERRLNHAGLMLVDTPFLTFDSSGELVVTPRPAIDPTTLDGIDLYRGTEAGSAPPGRHRVTGWLVDGRVGGEPREPVLRTVLDRDAMPADRAWRLVGRILDRALVLSLWHPWPDDLVSAIVRLAEGRR